MPGNNDPNRKKAKEPGTTRPAPTSPERSKATKMAFCYKICVVVGFALLIGVLISGCVTVARPAVAPIFILCLISFTVTLLLGHHAKRQEMKLRCTVRATAICVETVRVRTFSGKHYCLHPVVKFEANGVPRKATIPVICTRDAVGEPYVIYYDPLDPTTVRAE